MNSEQATLPVWNLLRSTYIAYRAEAVARHAAALAFYTVFALPPLLIVIGTGIWVFLDSTTLYEVLLTALEGFLTQDGAETLLTVLESTIPTPKRGVRLTALLLSGYALLFSTTRLFQASQNSLNDIWHVRPRRADTMRGEVKRRLLSWLTMLGILMLMIVAMLLATAITLLRLYVTDLVPDGFHVWRFLTSFLAFVIIAVLFAIIYRTLPHVDIAWDDVTIGAVVTAGLFSIGQWGISLYVTQVGFGTAYGAAGSLILLLFWIYFSAQLFLFGAVFTQIYANTYGRGVLPGDDADRIIRQTAAELEARINQIEERYAAEIADIDAHNGALEMAQGQRRRRTIFASIASLFVGIGLGILGLRRRQITSTDRDVLHYPSSATKEGDENGV